MTVSHDSVHTIHGLRGGMRVSRTTLTTDVARARERSRQRRLGWLTLVLSLVLAWLVYRALEGLPAIGPFPTFDPMYFMAGAFFLLLIVFLIGTTVVAGRSPHTVYRPEQIGVRMSDVKGVEPIKEDVQRSLDLLLGARTFRSTMGGTPRRGLLFEGPPGTGKTLMAKAMAAEAGVPFYFVSGTSFQSMYYGATARKIRSYFKALRKAARTEGAVIGFIEEIDAIATVRTGMPMTSTARSTRLPATVLQRVTSEGVGGVVNELLVQMQSFDEPTGWQRFAGWFIDKVNLFLPEQRTIPRPRPEPVDLLIIAATNRADSLDPALLRPGRFDRKLSFDLPDKQGRREILDHYLARKSHTGELDGGEYRDALAGVTQGYSPVMIENLLDEGLVNALRRGADAMTWEDLERARLVIEVGLGNPVNYTAHERRLIATHEAGHATVAHLETPERRLEVLTIIKRAGSLGLLAHGDAEDVYTRSRSEMTRLMRIAFGGMVAEELFFGDVSTGPSGDLAYATRLGAQMVGAAGMFDSLISFEAISGSAFGGSDLVQHVVGDKVARAALDRLLEGQRDHVRVLLEANRHLVEALRDALLERHELIGREITEVLAGAGPAVRIDGRPRPVTGLPAQGEDELVIDLREGAGHPVQSS